MTLNASTSKMKAILSAMLFSLATAGAAFASPRLNLASITTESPKCAWKGSSPATELQDTTYEGFRRIHRELIIADTALDLLLELEALQEIGRFSGYLGALKDVLPEEGQAGQIDVTRLAQANSNFAAGLKLEERLRFEGLARFRLALSCLDADVAKDVSAKFTRLSEDLFEYLAATRPKALACLISSRMLVATDLTYAAEAFGKSVDTSLVKSTLLPLLSFEGSSLVREGAAYGLAQLADRDSDVRGQLEKSHLVDPSEAVRAAIADILG